MADGKTPKKASSLADLLRQSLIAKLLAASDESRNAGGEVDGEKLREKQLAVLKDGEEKTKSILGIFAQLGSDVSAVRKFAAVGPHKLRELLVSDEAQPFDAISDLSARFGPLPKGYCYRYLAPESRLVSKATANRADNVIRLPTLLNRLVDKRLGMPGDEIPDRSLGEWLADQPAEVSRLWALRVLVLLGILKRADLPDLPVTEPENSSVPGISGPGSHTAALIAEFRKNALLHYEGEEKEDVASAWNGVAGKRSVVAQLQERSATSALVPLLDDSEISVRVSAATYLLPITSDKALDVIYGAAAVAADRLTLKHMDAARIHAWQTIWMHDDGNLGNRPALRA